MLFKNLIISVNEQDLKIIGGKISKHVISFFRFFLMFGLSFIILYPLLYMLCLAFRNPPELLDLTVVWLSKSFTLENIKNVIRITEYPKSFLITITISVGCSLFQCFTASLTGYGFARFKFKGRNILFFGALFTILVPPQIVMMPSYINFVNFTEYTGIPTINTIIPLIVPALLGSGIKAGLFVIIFRQFYKNLPKELEEAAYIDGCGPWMAYWRVIVLNAGPMILVSFILTFVWYWNDYFNVSLYYNKAQPLALQVANLVSRMTSSLSPSGTNYTSQEMTVYSMTACLLFIIPTLIVYVFLQKKFTQSIINAGIVG